MKRKIISKIFYCFFFGALFVVSMSFVSCFGWRTLDFDYDDEYEYEYVDDGDVQIQVVDEPAQPAKTVVVVQEPVKNTTEKTKTERSRTRTKKSDTTTEKTVQSVYNVKKSSVFYSDAFSSQTTITFSPVASGKRVVFKTVYNGMESVFEGTYSEYPLPSVTTRISFDDGEVYDGECSADGKVLSVPGLGVFTRQ